MVAMMDVCQRGHPKQAQCQLSCHLYSSKLQRASDERTWGCAVALGEAESGAHLAEELGVQASLDLGRDREGGEPFELAGDLRAATKMERERGFFEDKGDKARGDWVSLSSHSSNEGARDGPGRC